MQFFVVEFVMLASLHELLLTKCALIYWIFSTSALISNLSVVCGEDLSFSAMMFLLADLENAIFVF